MDITKDVIRAFLINRFLTVLSQVTNGLIIVDLRWNVRARNFKTGVSTKKGDLMYALSPTGGGGASGGDGWVYVSPCLCEYLQPHIPLGLNQ